MIGPHLGRAIRTLRFALAMDRTISGRVLPGRSLRRTHESGGATCAIAGASFVVHIAVLSTLSSDWADPVVDDRHVVAGIVEKLQVPHPGATAPVPAPSVAEPYRHQCAGSRRWVTEWDVQDERLDPRRTPALIDKLPRMSLAVITSPTGASPKDPLAPLLGDLEGLKDLWRPIRARHVDVEGGPQLELSVLTSEVVPREAEVTGSGRRVWDERVGRHVPAYFPGSSDTVLRDHTLRTCGEDHNLRRMRSALRACYRNGLGVDRTALGTVAFSLAVHPAGRVDQLAVWTERRVAAGVARCMEDVLWALRFHPLDAPRGVVRGEHGPVDPSSSLPRPAPRGQRSRLR